jgi:glycosyltransferase involved in cell wall biosynthesis
MVVEAFERVQTSRQCLIVGDAPYARQYIERIKSTKDPRIRFPGAIYGQGYRELQSHAYVYIHATEVGGTHPALIEAMGAGNCVIAYDTPENREVVGDSGIFFQDQATLVRQIQNTIDDQTLVERFRRKAANRAQSQYSWDAVTLAYEKLFEDLVQRC